MKYHVGQVVEFLMPVFKDGFTKSPVELPTLGRIYDIEEEFAPQINVRLKNGKSFGIMESDVIRVVPMETIKELMRENN